MPQRRPGESDQISDELRRANRTRAHDDIIANATYLNDMASITRERFHYELEMLEQMIIRDKLAPKFRDWPYETSGNRCRLYVRHALLMYLMYVSGNVSQAYLAGQFGITQPTASRYIRLVRKSMPEMVPTAEDLSEAIRRAKTKREVKAFMPGENGGTVLIDGFNTPVQRPHENDVRLEMYSGKNKQFALNTILYTNVDKLILGIGAMRRAQDG